MHTVTLGGCTLWIGEIAPVYTAITRARCPDGGAHNHTHSDTSTKELMKLGL